MTQACLKVSAMKESEFQLSLAKTIESFGHTVYLHDAGTSEWKRRFSSTGLHPDLLVETKPSWPDARKPISMVGVEAKVYKPHRLNEAAQGLFQIWKISSDIGRGAVYKSGSRILPSPGIFLYASPTLLKWDRVSFWRLGDPEAVASTCCADYATKQFEYLLNRAGSSLLRKDFSFFFENVVDGKPFARRMYLSR